MNPRLTLHAALLLLSGCRIECGTVRQQEPPTVSDEPRAAPPQAPPCMRDNCVERPAKLVCADLYRTASECVAWNIVYEHHCDCIEWAARPAQ